MAKGEFYGDPYPQTSLREMDLEIRRKIIDMAEEGHDWEALVEAFGEESVRIAATNNTRLIEMIEQASEGGYAA